MTIPFQNNVDPFLTNPDMNPTLIGIRSKKNAPKKGSDTVRTYRILYAWTGAFPGGGGQGQRGRPVHPSPFGSKCPHQNLKRAGKSIKCGKKDEKEEKTLFFYFITIPLYLAQKNFLCVIKNAKFDCFVAFSVSQSRL